MKSLTIVKTGNMCTHFQLGYGQIVSFFTKGRKESKQTGSQTGYRRLDLKIELTPPKHYDICFLLQIK